MHSDDVERLAYRQRVDIFFACRDAGQALTGLALRNGITVRSLIEVASTAATFTDTAIAMVKEEYRPRLECQEGCYSCCCKPGVLITVPELCAIVDHVQSTFDDAAVAGLRSRARRYTEQVAGRDVNGSFAESVPCPLLENQRCSIYKRRPLACRGYNSTDVTACRGALTDPNVLVPIFSVIRDAADGTSLGVAHSLKAAASNDAMLDLGTSLQIALDLGDQWGGVAPATGPAMRPAENRSWATDLWSSVSETARSLGIAAP